MFLRVKFNSADQSQSGTFNAAWRVGDPQKNAELQQEEIR